MQIYLSATSAAHTPPDLVRIEGYSYNLALHGLVVSS